MKGILLGQPVNPWRIEGQKTAVEIVDELGGPDWLVLLWEMRGHHCLLEGIRQHGSRRPRMAGFQAAGAAPIVLGRPVENPETPVPSG